MDLSVVMIVASTRNPAGQPYTISPERMKSCGRQLVGSSQEALSYSAGGTKFGSEGLREPGRHLCHTYAPKPCK